MTDGRPDPDRLLAAVNRGRARHRGRLKVFLGASAGVGKTYSMLSAAHEASRAGQEVVAAVVETHGRAETLAQLDGIEVLPRRRVDGYVDGELDLDATLARRADVSIVDELAHTNAPGSRHPKRWQDVLELVDAGLEVWTAVNVQHLESVNDVVARLTGVVVKETVPDHVLDHADEVEVVDLPPSELIERLEAGKVYGHGQAQRALKAFFREGNLLALRQIALRRAAERVGAQLDDWRDAEAMPEVWSGGERLLVAVGPSPLSGQLVRVAARLARQLDAGWHAVTVRPPARDDASTRRALEQLSLAESLGASTAVLTSDDVAAELVTYARRVNATTLVLGASAPRWLERSLVDRVTRLARDIHVHVVPAPHATRSTPPDREVSWPERVAPRELVLGVGGVAAASALGWGLGGASPESGAMLLLTAVAAAAVRLPWHLSLLVALGAAAAFSALFDPAAEVRLLAVAVMAGGGVSISTLASRARERARVAGERAEGARALFALTRGLARCEDGPAVARALAAAVHGALTVPVVVHLWVEDHLEPAASLGPAIPGDTDAATADWAARHGVEAGRGTETLPAAHALYLPLEGRGEALGVVGLVPLPRAGLHDPERRDLVRSMAAAAGQALLRLTSTSDELRATHAGIAAAARALDDPRFDPTARELGRRIGALAERLERSSGPGDTTDRPAGAAE